MKKFLTFCSVIPLLLVMNASADAATAVPFTVNMSEPVTVDTSGGTPRIAIDVGGVTRYASYDSGSGTSTLTFTYTTSAGDLDLDGIALTSPLQLNGGIINDLSGNTLSNLTYTAPNTSGIKIDHPSLSMDLTAGTTGAYTLNSTAYTSFSSFLAAAGGTFNRSGASTYIDSSGNMQTASANTPRFDHDPATLAGKGIQFEAPRINYIRNGNATGAAAGNPGTLPTNWSSATFAANGLSSEILATGTENGINYVDVRLYGTPTNTTPVLYFEAPAQIAASTSQIWSGSIYLKQIGGSLAGISSVNTRIVPRDGGGAPLAAYASPAITMMTTGRLSALRYTQTSTLVAATTTRVQFGLIFSTIIGTPVDISFRVGAPQLEQGNYATSYIPTTTIAVARGVDDMIVPVGSWYNQPAGTFMNDVSWMSPVDINYPMFFRMDDATNAHRWNAYYSQIGNNIGVDAYTSAAGQGAFNHPASPTGTAKIASAQALNNFNASFNGSLKTLDVTHTPPTVTRMGLTGTHAVKWFKTLKYYPSRVSEAQLTLLTQ